MAANDDEARAWLERICLGDQGAMADFYRAFAPQVEDAGAALVRALGHEDALQAGARLEHTGETLTDGVR